MSNSLISGVFAPLKTLSFENFAVIFSTDFNEQLTAASGSELSAETKSVLLPLIKNLTTDFRLQLTVKTTPFLFAFFYATKEIRVYSPRLHNELFILQNGAEIKDSAEFKALENHVSYVLKQNLKSFPSIVEVLTKTEKLTDLNTLGDVDERAKTIVQKLLFHVNSYSPSLFEKISDYALGLTAQYALLRIHLLKFLAILPSLDHDKKGVEVKRILLEALKRFLKDNKKASSLKKKGQNRALPFGLTTLLTLVYHASKICPAYPLATIVRFKVRFMAKRFIAGESIENADKSLRALFETGRDVTLDQLGELVVSEVEADHYMEEVLKLIRGFSLHVKKGEKNKAGILKAHVSIKVSALSSDFKPHAPEYTFSQVAPRLKKILLEAKSHQVFINIDAEHYHYRDIVFYVYKRLLLETPDLKDYKDTGIVIQAYLRDGFKHLKEIIELARTRKILMPVRLVKGAYWDAETVEGDAHGFNAPQFLNKEETDIHFRQLIVEILSHDEELKLCLASHNFSDHAFAEALCEKRFPKAGPIEHQCLHMTYEALSTALAKMNWATRNYVPVGSLLVGMAYLVRRIMENSSQVGVLTIMRSHKKQTSLVSPLTIHTEKKNKGELALDLSQGHLCEEFFNVGPVRLYLEDQRIEMEKSLAAFKEKFLGKEYKLAHIKNGIETKVHSSSDPKLMVGSIPFASNHDAESAIHTIDQDFYEGEWSHSPWIVRTKALLRASEIMLSKRLELAALIMYEAGKSVNEALGDVDEAIDFLTFYARSVSDLRKNHKNLCARGPVAVIAPWNFPLAIPCGMVSGALVAGNTVILKSAEQTPLIAEELIQIFYAAGIPKTALLHVPGLGETVGATLVASEKISTVIFTGSKAVGTHIFKTCATRIYKNRKTGKMYPTLAITEMGGKNAIIVTQNAELDETVSGILQSAFGHGGQKCSALSRVIVHESLKDKLIIRLREAAKGLAVGSALDFKTFINPLISENDRDRVRNIALEAREEIKKYGGTVVIDRTTEARDSYALGPAIFEIPFARALENGSVARKEIFGPVIHVIGFKDTEDAIKLFNSTEYALTGGVFSQSQDDLDYLTSKLECGNLYINRTITGARVAIEPFGGFKMSGTGPKAGGISYIHALHQNKEIVALAENSMVGGSDLELTLLHPSMLNFSSKEERIKKFMDHLLSSFESFVGDVRANEKQTLVELRKWISGHYQGFFTKEHSNRKIPGQISVNSHVQFVRHALVVAVQKRPQLNTLLQVIAAVSTGTGTLVAARNEESYQFWMKIRDSLYKAGFSKENFDVFFVSENALTKLLAMKSLELVIYDGQLENMHRDVVSGLLKSRDNTYLTQVMTVHDYYETGDFCSLFLKFVHVRSLAINTMRHGAPLDLEI